MGSERDHMERAEGNQRIARELAPDGDGSEFLGARRWCVITCHYAGLEFVHALLARQDIHPSNHQEIPLEIINLLRADGRGTDGTDVANAIRTLRAWSEGARYLRHNEHLNSWWSAEFGDEDQAANEALLTLERLKRGLGINP